MIIEGLREEYKGLNQDIFDSGIAINNINKSTKEHNKDLKEQKKELKDVSDEIKEYFKLLEDAEKDSNKRLQEATLDSELFDIGNRLEDLQQNQLDIIEKTGKMRLDQIKQLTDKEIELRINAIDREEKIQLENAKNEIDRRAILIENELN